MIQPLNKIFLGLSFVTFLLSLGTNVWGQVDTKTVRELEVKIDSIIRNNMESQNIPGAAYVLVNKDRTLLKKGFGYATLGENKTKVDPDSTIFRIGSISKTFTAAALLQLVDMKMIDLDKDVNSYLSEVRVPSSFSEAVTSRHLLTHSSGFDELGGRRVFDSEELIPLGEFLKDQLIRIREPGILPSYSTHAIALAGLVVENVSKQSLENYMKQNIWDPLDMKMTSMAIPKGLANKIATGYELDNGINLPQPWEYYHTYPASEINSTVMEMGNYMRLFLNKGSFLGKQVLSENAALSMTTQQLPKHEDVDGFAFGFYKRTRFGVESFGHGGDMLGFSSFLMLLPEKELGFFIVSHHEGGSLRTIVNDAILEYFSKDSEEKKPKPYVSKTGLSEFEGSYRWTIYCHTCLDSYIPQSRSVTANEDNTLSGFGRKFYQASPLLFKSMDGSRTMSFVKDSKGKVKFMTMGNIDSFEKVE